MSTTKHALLLFLPACIMAVAGCTAPVFRISDLADPGTVSDVKASGDKKVCVPLVETPNNKPPENIVGQAKVGMFNMKAPIKADTSVDVLMTTLVKKAFAAAGFHVTECPDADLTIKGKFDKVWVDEYATGLTFEYAKSHVMLDIMVNDKSGKTIWANSIDKFQTSPDNSMDATHLDIPTLSSNLKSAMQEIFKDQGFWKAVNATP
jgi:hypothetical protein